MSSRGLDGTFATPAARRRERRWQTTGVALLTVVVLAAFAYSAADRGVVLRSAGVYVFLLAVFRVAGRRTLAQVTNFDLILVLIIGDATQQAIVGDDTSLTAGVLAVSTLLLMDIALARAKYRWPLVDAVVDGLPLPLVKNGAVQQEQMQSEGIAADDVIAAARETQGLARLEDVEHAILEPSGGISVVPRRP